MEKSILTYTFIVVILPWLCAQTSEAIFDPKGSHPVETCVLPRVKLYSALHNLAVSDPFGSYIATYISTDFCPHSTELLRL